MFLNLDRFSETPSLDAGRYVLGVIVLPMVALLAGKIWSRWGSRRRPGGAEDSGMERAAGSTRMPAAAQAAVEALDEIAEVDP